MQCSNPIHLNYVHFLSLQTITGSYKHHGAQMQAWAGHYKRRRECKGGSALTMWLIIQPFSKILVPIFAAHLKLALTASEGMLKHSQFVHWLDANLTSHNDLTSTVLTTNTCSQPEISQ